jgi:hypothetical protein
MTGLGPFQQGVVVGGIMGIAIGQTILGLILSLHDGDRDHIDPE